MNAKEMAELADSNISSEAKREFEWCLCPARRRNNRYLEQG